MEVNFENIDISSHKPVHLQIAEIIETKIRNKELLVNQKLPSHNKLHQIFKVSKNTIGDAISSLVDEGYLASKQKYGTVVINTEPKKGLNLSKRNVICMVVCADTEEKFKTIQTRFFSEVVNGVGSKIKEKNLHLLYKMIGASADSLDFGEKEREIAGLVVGGSVTPEDLRIIKKTKLPFVLIGDIYQGAETSEQVDIIANDDSQGAYIATKHLTGLGHRRILYFTSSYSKYHWEKEYLNGYLRALKDANIVPDENLLLEARSDNFDDLYATISGLLDRVVDFTGMVCTMNKDLYFAVLKAFNQKNIRIPEDISAVMPEVFPGVTAITKDMDEMGRMAVTRLIERVTNPEWKPERIIIPNKLVLGDSTRKI